MWTAEEYNDMTSPILNRVVFLLTGLWIAVTVPAGAGYAAFWYSDSLIVAVVVGVVVVYQLMATSVALLSIMQYVPNGVPLGPSFMAGHGMLTLLMTAVPLLAIPGIVWLYVLPFDEQGYLGGDIFEFDRKKIEQPNHADSA